MIESIRGVATLFVMGAALGLAATASCDRPDSNGAGSATAGNGGGGQETPGSVVISAGTRSPVTVTRAINYWTWAPTYSDDVTGTESKIAQLRFSVMRVGGYNNDANFPDGFDDAQLDKAVAYARAIGAEPLIQVPVLAGPDHLPATPNTAAAMVTYANVTKSYGLKYFSIGNEPDLYARQGNLTDPKKPAIPNYGPADFCTNARAYAAAMKAVDPSIRIVGPDLGFQYTPGMDFLTPLLKLCGDLFDVIAVHRYAGSSAQATVANISKDVDKFRHAVLGLHATMQAAGYGDKPLAITELNIDYDALPTSGVVPAAACGTVPSALWAADILGASRELDLWTTAFWDLSDDQAWQLGLLEEPPSHQPRPQYYAQLLYALHSGPVRLDVKSSPSGVNVYASRNAADDTTQAIVVNWNAKRVALDFRVSDLTPTPATATFTVPALSIAAVDIPDRAPASALVYGKTQHDARGAAMPLEPGIPAEDLDAGAADASLDPDADADGSQKCAQVRLRSPLITSEGTGAGSTLFFGSGSERWGAYGYASPGQTAPTGTASANGNGLEIAGGFVLPLTSSNNYAGFGLYFDGTGCVDASEYTGIQFDLSGDRGACSLSFAVTFSDDVSTSNDPARGRCAEASCLEPQVPLTVSSGTVKIPFASLRGGVPVDGLDPTTILGLQWQLDGPPSDSDSGGACTAKFSVENLTFY